MKKRTKRLMQLLGVTTFGLMLAAVHPVNAQAAEEQPVDTAAVNDATEINLAAETDTNTKETTDEAAVPETEGKGVTSPDSGSGETLAEGVSGDAESEETGKSDEADVSDSGSDSTDAKEVSQANQVNPQGETLAQADETQEQQADEKTEEATDGADIPETEEEGVTSADSGSGETLAEGVSGDSESEEIGKNDEADVSDSGSDSFGAKKVSQTNPVNPQDDFTLSAAKSNGVDGYSEENAEEEQTGESAEDGQQSVGESATDDTVTAGAKGQTIFKAPAAEDTDHAPVVVDDYNKLTEAIQNAHNDGKTTTIKITGNIEDIISDITIDSGKIISITSDGTNHSITFKDNKKIVVKNGSLILGEGSSNSTLTVQGNSTVIDVGDKGNLTIKDGATVKEDENNGGNVINIRSGAEYHGEGGTVEGGTLNFEKGSKGYIKGGNYSNANSGAVIEVNGGHLSELSGGATGLTITASDSYAHPAVSIRNGGRIDAIYGTDSAQVEIKNKLGHGIQLWHGGHIGTIGKDGEKDETVKITSGENNGYHRGYGAIRLYDDENVEGEEPSSIDTIFCGIFNAENYGLALSGNATNFAHVGTISGGQFIGGTNGLNVNHYASVNTISGGVFYGAAATGIDSPNDTIKWGGAGLWNFGDIQEITGGTFKGWDGLVNYSNITLINGATFSAQGQNGSGIINTQYLTWCGKIGEISDAIISGGKNGIGIENNYSQKSSGREKIVSINSIKNCTISGGKYGITNAYGINTTTGSVIKNITECEISGGEYGIWNGRNALDESNRKVVLENKIPVAVPFIGSINGSVVKGSICGIYNSYSEEDAKAFNNLRFSVNPIINYITGSTAENDSNQGVGAGFYNEGTIKKISDSTLKGGYAGLINTRKAELNIIEKSMLIGTKFGAKNDGEAKLATIGDYNIIYGTGKNSFGYYNGTSNKTLIEPNLANSKKGIGTGRYYGSKEAIFAEHNDKDVENDMGWSGFNGISYPVIDKDKNIANSKIEARLIFYHLSSPNVAREDVEAYAKQGFLYLKKTLKLIYDKNDPSATGSVDPHTESSDAENIEISDNGFINGTSRFIGWNTKPDGSGVWYYPENDIVLDDDTVLYAIWEAPKPSTPDETPTTPEEVEQPEKPEESAPEEIEQPEKPDEPAPTPAEPSAPQSTPVEIARPEEPESPAPETPESVPVFETTPVTFTTASVIPQTSDPSQPGMYTLLFVAAGMGLVAAGKKKKKESDEE